MPKFFKAPTGTFDILPADHDYLTFFKKVVRHRFRQAGFRRITTPFFEESEAFERSLGTSSSIFTRELYSFKDRQGREYTLRPEVTTGVVRSFIEHKMYTGPLPAELYYIEPCFRFERPNSRTRRQFWQVGCEILGESDPAIDAQIIYLGHRILEDLKIRKFCDLKINTFGDPEDRKRYFNALENFYQEKERSLSPSMREKLKQKRYFDLLTPTTEDEEILVEMAPKMIDHLSKESRDFFDETLVYLNSFGIEYTIDPALVRPVEYYCHTVFEFREKNSKNKVLVGGRYDGLLKKMGAEKVYGGAGFAAGVDRVTALMKSHKIEVPHKDFRQIFLAATGSVAKKQALPLLVKLREHGFHAVGVLGKTSIQDQVIRAEKFKVPYMLLMGDLEVQKNQVIIRNMKNRKQEVIDRDIVIEKMTELLGNPPLDSTEDFLGHE